MDRQQDNKPRRPRLGVFKFASCDGCQLSILNLEDDLLALGQVLDIAYFPEASSSMEAGPYDIALVEGSIATPEDAQRILSVRKQANALITIGACATVRWKEHGRDQGSRQTPPRWPSNFTRGSGLSRSRSCEDFAASTVMPSPFGMRATLGRRKGEA